MRPPNDLIVVQKSVVKPGEHYLRSPYGMKAPE